MKTLHYTDLTRAQKRMVERVYSDFFCPHDLNGNTRKNLINKGWIEVVEDVVQLTREGREAYRGWLHVKYPYVTGHKSGYPILIKQHTEPTARRKEVLKQYQQMARKALGLKPL